MDQTELRGRLAFLRHAEGLKNALRSAHTSEGRTESTAEHTWRLCLLAMTFEDQLPGLDFVKVLKMCVIHDLGETINGDIPAVDLDAAQGKADNERRDLLQLMRPLAPAVRDELLALWEDYEAAASPEARAVKALDKLETIMQHNQGVNPEPFDYAFNLTYGSRYMAADPLFAQIRAELDADTRRRIAEHAHTAR